MSTPSSQSSASSFEFTRCSFGPRQPRHPPAVSTRDSNSKTLVAKGSSSSASGSSRSSAACLSVSSAGSLYSGKTQKAMLKEADAEIKYWEQRGKSRTNSATSSVFADILSADTRTRDRLWDELWVVKDHLLTALGLMSPLFSIPPQLGVGTISYDVYAELTHLGLTEYRVAVKHGHAEPKNANRRLGASLMRKLIPKFEKDVREISEAFELSRTRRDSQYTKECRALLVKKRAHVEAFKNCKTIENTLQDYYHMPMRSLKG